MSDLPRVSENAVEAKFTSYMRWELVAFLSG
jgi:hypothetical protein